MLNGIHLVDYGNHRDTRLTFGRMTALVGQNGAGKTNVMKAILEIERFYKDKDARFNSVPHTLRYGCKEWILEASWPGSLNKQLGQWAMQVSSRKSDEWLWRNSASEDHRAWLPTAEDWAQSPSWHDERSYSYMADTTGFIEPGTTVKSMVKRANKGTWACRYFKTSGSLLKGPSYSETIPPVLGEDCRDIAWIISYLKGAKDEIFDQITDALCQVVPTFRQLKNSPALILKVESKKITINDQQQSYDEKQTVVGQELRFDMASGRDLPTSQISDGTLVSLAILTAAIHENNGTAQTILLDDIESGLHPTAQRSLIRQLRRLQDARPELQIIFSSHSPYIIDEMKPEDVWLFATDEKGVAHAARLDEHPDTKRATEILTTGEFWSAEGENWVLDRGTQVDEKPTAAK